jgi:hypothetical protein
MSNFLNVGEKSKAGNSGGCKPILGELHRNVESQPPSRSESGMTPFADKNRQGKFQAREKCSEAWNEAV